MSADRKSILLLSVIFLLFSCEPHSLFQKLSSRHTGIDFKNTLQETELYNMVSFSNFYTGGGIGIGDINNDGLPDIFFGGNMVASRLYTNQGDLQFVDISEKAGILQPYWATGISMVDINTDGWLDIYVSTSGHPYGDNYNKLYINQKDETFIEQASEYGLDVNAQVTHSSFFDYDLDGDLDVFMAINPTDFQLHMMGRISSRKTQGEALSTDKLFRNNGDGTFSDVSVDVGILIEGYSLGVNTSDFNNDGWIDIFVSNDYVTNDILYINNGDGTFSDQLSQAFKHTSFASMGTDVGDFNNDGLLDIVTVDMYPESNYREKTLVSGGLNSYYILKNRGYVPQHTRNVLYLNMGDGTFSEIGRLANIHRTDWSWAPLFTDLDNDGHQDLYVTNGFAKEVGNLDFITYNQNSPFVNPGLDQNLKLESIIEQEGVPLNNYLFKNNGDYTFKNITVDGGVDIPSISNGAAYADLDLDGDLELVVNNIDQDAFIFKNQCIERGESHYLQIDLSGPPNNPDAIGAVVTVYTDGSKQIRNKNPYRGYLSSMDQILHFGISHHATIDSIIVKWPDNTEQVVANVKADQRIEIHYEGRRPTSKQNTPDCILREVSAELSLSYSQKPSQRRDFQSQPLVPQVATHLGPAIAIADIDRDGRDDFIVGGMKGTAAQVHYHRQGGKFSAVPFPFDSAYHDVGLLLFDANQDGYVDLYAVSGNSTNSPPTATSIKLLQDRLYYGDGNGGWVRSKGALPEIKSSGSCVIAGDYDQDGDLDLFVGGRMKPGQYPLSPRSYLLQNNNGVFTDITLEVDSLENIGMVSSALWTDYNTDGWLDLMVVGEWMQIEFFKNTNGKLKRVTQNSGLESTYGWWNSLTGADFDMDGDIDYIAGNHGTNTHYRATVEEPLCIYANDFDGNGSIDPILCQYNEGQNYPTALRGDLLRQLPSWTRRFPDYESYAHVNAGDLLSEFSPEEIQIYKATCLTSSYIENLGNGKFAMRPLPHLCQSAPINGMHVADINRDGWLDILLVGNNFSNEVFHGMQDALDGLCLINNEGTSFEVWTSRRSGFKVPGDAKALVALKGDGKRYFLTSQNGDSLLAFDYQGSEAQEVIEADLLTTFMQIELADGRSFRHEFYYGSGYLSQSSRSLRVFAASGK